MIMFSTVLLTFAINNMLSMCLYVKKNEIAFEDQTQEKSQM